MWLKNLVIGGTGLDQNNIFCFSIHTCTHLIDKFANAHYIAQRNSSCSHVHKGLQGFTWENYYFANFTYGSKTPCMIIIARILVAVLHSWIFWMVELHSLPKVLITVVLLIELLNPQAFYKTRLGFQHCIPLII